MERKALPYGAYRFEDGTEILFTRDHFPIWERTGQGKATPFRSFPRGRHGKQVEQRWFYNDEVSHSERRERSLAVLREWGLPLPGAAGVGGAA